MSQSLVKSIVMPPSEAEQWPWFRMVFQIKGSVLITILPRVIVVSLFGLFISVLHFYKLPVAFPALSNLVPSIVLGLLLVFRTNTAYDRFWEGRKMWGNIINTGRNLATQIWVAIEEKKGNDLQSKKTAMRLIAAFAIATKRHLRSEPVNEELERLVPEIYHTTLRESANPPIKIAIVLREYLQQQYERGCLNSYQLASMFRLVDILIEALGACERILKTPVPFAYSIHLKQLLMLYCLALPLQMVKDLGLMTFFAVALISFAVFGIEQIGIEIENPFGYDPNDLPLNAICANLERGIEEIITLGPTLEPLQEQSDII